MRTVLAVSLTGHHLSAMASRDAKLSICESEWFSLQEVDQGARIKKGIPRPEMNDSKVLAITKRTASLCGTQSLLYSVGMDLVTATSMDAALSVIKAVPTKGVIVCKHSWSDAERTALAAELAANHPEVAVVSVCPGCTGCDESACKPGSLEDTAWLWDMVATMATA